jgi:hypothetical protein
MVPLNAALACAFLTTTVIVPDPGATVAIVGVPPVFVPLLTLAKARSVVATLLLLRVSV